MTTWWVPRVGGVGLCISAARQTLRLGEREARRLAKVYRVVDLERQRGEDVRVVLRIRDGKLQRSPRPGTERTTAR